VDQSLQGSINEGEVADVAARAVAASAVRARFSRERTVPIGMLSAWAICS
jgi:hypothetical protein